MYKIYALILVTVFSLSIAAQSIDSFVLTKEGLYRADAKVREAKILHAKGSAFKTAFAEWKRSEEKELKKYSAQIKDAMNKQVINAEAKKAMQTYLLLGTLATLGKNMNNMKSIATQKKELVAFANDSKKVSDLLVFGASIEEGFSYSKGVDVWLEQQMLASLNRYLETKDIARVSMAWPLEPGDDKIANKKAKVMFAFGSAKLLASRRVTKKQIFSLFNSEDFKTLMKATIQELKK